jgi:hypothetical protein
MLSRAGQHGYRSLAAGAVAPLMFAALGGLAGCARGDHAPLTFAISFPAERSATPLDGRVLLFISDDSTKEPRFQTDEYRANSTRPIFGIDVDSLKPGEAAIISDTVFGFPARSLKDIPAGDYWVQALFNRFETFHRSDGKTVKLPPDMGEGQSWSTKPGNFYSKPVKMHVDPASSSAISISMDQVIPPIQPPQDSKQVKYIKFQSDRLTKFWGRPMYLGAIVLLPAGWDAHPNARYPLLINHGHYPKTLSPWRETPPDPKATGQQLEVQQLSYQLYKDWNGPHFPRMVQLLVQHPTPYFDDSYAVNSANNGPYGDAITYELIPYIEKQYRGIGQGWARVMVGGSTGGWETLGVQVMYPDDYNGAWALCPDPVDFRAYRSVDIYDSHNAYTYDDNPWKHTYKPGYRDNRGRLYSTFMDRNQVELAIGGPHGRSGGQHDAWESVFGPVGDDGYFKPLFDRVTGQIDPTVAQYWKDHYDLRNIMERDWAKLGPKLRGKIHVTSGTMDNGYLNNAVYYLDDFFKAAKNPPADAEVIYGDRREHCFTGDVAHPNLYGALTIHQRFMPAMAAWIIKTAPAGADTKSWRY